MNKYLVYDDSGNYKSTNDYGQALEWCKLWADGEDKAYISVLHLTCEFNSQTKTYNIKTQP